MQQRGDNRKDLEEAFFANSEYRSRLVTVRRRRRESPTTLTSVTRPQSQETQPISTVDPLPLDNASQVHNLDTQPSTTVHPLSQLRKRPPQAPNLIGGGGDSSDEERLDPAHVLKKLRPVECEEEEEEGSEEEEEPYIDLTDPSLKIGWVNFNGEEEEEEEEEGQYIDLTDPNAEIVLVYSSSSEPYFM